MKESLNYVHIVPDSHFWSDLNQLINAIEFDINWHNTKEEKEDLIVSVNMYKPLSKEYLMVGLKNSLKNGYEIKYNKKYKTKTSSFLYFNSINDIIKNIETNNNELSLGILLKVLQSTLNNGYNFKNNKKMERKDVYDRLDTERKYQDLRWSTRRTTNGTPDEEKPPAEWINYMEYHLSKAKDAVYHLQTDDALAEVRKVIALGVRCMELHGCPERVIPPNLEEDVE